MTPIAWVCQEDQNGCGVAVLAMLTGQSYSATRDDLLAYGDWLGHDGNFERSGVSHIVLDRYLGERGFFLQLRYEVWYEGAIPVPFAPLHYASVKQPSGNSHFVVVLDDGSVLDPMRQGRFELGDWPGVNYVAGLHRPCERAARSELEQAIADMRFARQTHAEWAAYLEHPQTDVREERPQEDVAGDSEHHRDWVAKYDRVLAILEGDA